MNAVTETKPEHANIATALAAAQAEMGKALKQANNQHFRNKYADLGNVMDACLPALNKHGIALIQPTGEDEVGRYVETCLVHLSGETLRCRVPLIVQKNDMQGYGSAVTYARRYGLMCMAGIAPEDDDGNAAAKAAPAKNERTTGSGQRQKSSVPEDPFEPVQMAIDSLANADTLDALQAIWTGENFPRAHPKVQAAKDRRKDELTPNIDDEVPY